MTRKYLTKNQYGLSPQVAEEITSAIEKLHFIHPLLNHQVTFKAVTGCINGTVDEYDNEFTIKDTVRIYLDGEHFGELIVMVLNLISLHSMTPRQRTSYKLHSKYHVHHIHISTLRTSQIST